MSEKRSIHTVPCRTCPFSDVNISSLEKVNHERRLYGLLYTVHSCMCYVFKDRYSVFNSCEIWAAGLATLTKVFCDFLSAIGDK